MKDNKQTVQSVELKAIDVLRPYMANAPIEWVEMILNNSSDSIRVFRRSAGIFDVHLMKTTKDLCNPIQALLLMTLTCPLLALIDYKSENNNPESIRFFVNHHRIKDLPTLIKLSKEINDDCIN